MKEVLESKIDNVIDKIVSYVKSDELRESMYDEMLEYSYSRDISNILYEYNVCFSDKIVRYVIVNVWSMLRYMKFGS